MSSKLTSHPESSDSEDDADYVPPADEGSEDSEDSDSETKAAQAESLKPAEDDEARAQSRAALWSSFQSSISATHPAAPPSEPPKMIKIQRRYRFAGEDVVEVVDVPENSPDAKKWPLFEPDKGESSTLVADTVASSSALDTNNIDEPNNTPTFPRPPPKKPGPRKSRTTLSAIPSASKAKKLSTLDKSAMDWKAHIQAEQASGLKDELEANRRGGGYLEKVEFLQRVDERKEENFEALKSNKRRRL